jgi:hypothetical protein
MNKKRDFSQGKKRSSKYIIKELLEIDILFVHKVWRPHFILHKNATEIHLFFFSFSHSILIILLVLLRTHQL